MASDPIPFPLTRRPDPHAGKRILRMIRPVMAGGGSSEDRLRKIVRLIAGEMGVQVCSCYVMRAGEVLELFATHGLNQAAIHVTRMEPGEGLVGEIASQARPLALSDARAHRAFSYRPETDEDPFLSFCGVPVLRDGRVRGVLVIQTRDHRVWSEDDLETLETLAMIAAELIAALEAITPQEISSAKDVCSGPCRIDAAALNSGLGMGVAVLHDPRPVIREIVSENPTHELERLREAMLDMHGAIADILDSAREEDDSDPRDILQAYRMVAEDRGWLSRINEAILQGLTAEAAVRHVQDGIRNRLRQVSDPYLRERLADFEDLANRLIQHLAGVGPGQYGIAPNEDFILIARNMGPGELFDYDRSRLKGLVLEEGGPSSHVALIAKALEIPVVGRCIGALDAIEPLDRILVDADNGQVFVRPTADIQAAFIETINSHDKRCARYRHSRYMPSVSLDGIRIELMLNAGLLIDLKHLADTDADGIGLYRTEIPFMVRGSFPDVRDQTELYAQAFDYAGEKPVIFRTLDVGGDKNLPYLRVPGEDNPALGWRGVRILLDRPAVLRQQLRAMIRAAAGHDLNVMFPMVGETFELAAAHHILDLELSRESERGSKMPRKIRVGVMLEVPSLLFQLDSLCSKVDFISIGSNDLLQYMFAADRGNPRIEGRFDTLSPAFLRALRNAADACRKHDVDLSLCGEMAGRPLEAMALIGIGITSLSMAPQSIGPVREMVRSLDAAPLAAWMERRLETASDSLREELAGFARDHNVAMQAIADSPINLV